jgi:hypothetical protein
MGIDGKYGRVTTEFGTIAEDEPVVVFRAQDKLLPALLDVYARMCADAGSPAHHIARINESRDEIADWQEQEHHHTQVPNSDNYIERLRKAGS